ncbi:MAG: hypothetical protein HY040_18950 [Planctomycetes bacterium]|nr:hypothetical protein [Planctomycetota bacterium]
MARLLVLALMFLVALVPPGFCACRLGAMLLPSEESATEESDSPDDGDDHDGHSCGSLLPDAVAPVGVSFAVQGDHLEGVVPPVASIAQGPHFHFRSLVDAPTIASPPLYLTLRALLI